MLEGMLMTTGDREYKLPIMQSDITLSQSNRVLIIDAKYYTHTTQMQYDVHTLHSNNLYQIFTYVSANEWVEADEEKSDMF